MPGEEKKKGTVILTGVPEIDEKLGGGIPVGSLGLIEGQPDSGKSVICQHLAYGALTVSELSAAYYTTENSVRSLISQMDSLSLFTKDYFLMDRFRIYPLALKRATSGDRLFKLLTVHIDALPERFKLVIIDSVTNVISHNKAIEIVDFFMTCKQACDKGRSVILVAHHYAFEEESLARSRSVCDAHLRTRLEDLGERMIPTMEVLKVRGADHTTGDVVSFEIEPKIGMRIIPLSRAKV